MRRALHAARHHIRMRCQSCRGAKQSLEMEWTHRGRVGHLVQARRGVQRIFDQCRHARESARIESAANAFRRARREVADGYVYEQVVDEFVCFEPRQRRCAAGGHSPAGTDAPDDGVVLGLCDERGDLRATTALPTGCD
jgi:hypothetical protein